MAAIKVTDPTHPSHLLEGFVAMRKAGELFDYTIKGSDQSFSFHSLVLASMSPVFKAMIMSSFDESEKKEATFPTIPDDIMKKIIDFAYTGVFTYTSDDLIALIAATHFLEMSKLLKLCEDQISTVLSPSNCFSWSRIAEKFELETIRPQIQKMMFSAHEEVIQSEEFQDADVSEIVVYLSSLINEGVHSDIVLESALQWVKHDSSNRSVHMPELFACVSVDKCNRLFLSTVVEENAELLDTQPHLHKQILRDILTGDSKQNEELLILGGQLYDNMPNNDIWMFKYHRLVKFAEGPGDDLRPFHSICQVPQGMMVTGGENSDICKLFDVANKTWLDKAKLLSKRARHCSGYNELKVFVIGGQIVGDSSGKSVDYLDLEMNTWQHGPDLPRGGNFPKVTVCNSRLYVLLTSEGLMYCLDSGCRSWTQCHSQPIQSYGCSMTTVDDRMFIAGGDRNVSYMYVPAADTWCLLNEPSLTERQGALVSYKQKLYLVAGCARDGNEQAVEVYDIKSDSWSLAAWKLPKPLWLHAAFVVTGDLLK